VYTLLNARFGLSHIASDPEQCLDAIAKLTIDFANFTFIDVGAGKGRALILAARFPFRRLIGVEFAVELVKAAEANLAMPAVVRLSRSRIEMIHTDALTFDFPPHDPLVVYLFNPFGASIIRGIAKNLFSSLKQNPQAVEVIYMNPIHLMEFLEEDGHLRKT
jgi:predicted RNA methylase